MRFNMYVCMDRRTDGWMDSHKLTSKPKLLKEELGILSFFSYEL